MLFVTNSLLRLSFSLFRHHNRSPTLVVDFYCSDCSELSTALVFSPSFLHILVKIFVVRYTETRWNEKSDQEERERMECEPCTCDSDDDDGRATERRENSKLTSSLRKRGRREKRNEQEEPKRKVKERGPRFPPEWLTRQDVEREKEKVRQIKSLVTRCRYLPFHSLRVHHHHHCLLDDAVKGGSCYGETERKNTQRTQITLDKYTDEFATVYQNRNTFFPFLCLYLTRSCYLAMFQELICQLFISVLSLYLFLFLIGSLLEYSSFLSSVSDNTDCQLSQEMMKGVWVRNETKETVWTKENKEGNVTTPITVCVEGKERRKANEREIVSEGMTVR